MTQNSDLMDSSRLDLVSLVLRDALIAHQKSLQATQRLVDVLEHVGQAKLTEVQRTTIASHMSEFLSSNDNADAWQRERTATLLNSLAGAG